MIHIIVREYVSEEFVKMFPNIDENFSGSVVNTVHGYSPFS